MKCKECNHAVKGFFACKPDKHVCIGVKEPFVIENLDVECTEYPEKNETIEYTCAIVEPVIAEPFVDDDGIYIPDPFNPIYHSLLISKELFVEAYNKWIKGEIE